MNKRISQFELTNTLQDNDLITLVQDGQNKNITGGNLTTSLSNTFATNERVDGIEEDISELDTKVDNNYTDLSNKIKEGDETVTNNLTSNITSYYDVLNNKIITLDEKHDTDMSEVNNTVQEWIEEIDEKSTLEQLQDALNRLTVAENTITSLAEIIANGGGSGSVPGYHTQSTATIFPLTGYYKGSSADALATTDTLNQALSKLENQIEAVSSSSGFLPLIKMGESTLPTDNNLYTAGKVKEDFIYKTGDTVPGRIIYTTGIQGGTTFRSGWDGVGASLYPVNSKWNLELDNLFVRGNMTVNQLTVNEIKAVGGDILVSVADMKCTEVEELSDGYKCYFDTEDGTKYNQFIINDQAICQKFDGKDVKRYWRAVTEVGTDYIVLSKEICEPGSGTPSAEDEIILLGHRVEGDQEYNEQMNDRRNAIFISAKGADAPRIAFYSGIDDFSLEGKDRTVIGKNSKFTGSIVVVGADGYETQIPIYRGAWSADKTYYYYDYVSYNGSLWIATVENTNQVPSKDSIYWDLYVPKGEDGKSGDDVAKWVEIVGNRMFLYNTPDFSGDPTPTNLSLVANVYGIPNPSYEWEDQVHTVVGYGNSLVVTPEMMHDRTEVFRCTVTDQDTGAAYYDETQVAKLANGADGTSGMDAYYIDLTNYSASVPFDANGNILVVPTTIYTDVFAYHGIEQIQILSMTAEFTSGAGSCSVSGNRVTLQSLETPSARITLTITVENNIEIEKYWYINQSKDGEAGFDGEDAVRTYLTGTSQFFHYKEYASIPDPTTITLKMDSNIAGGTYQWYYAPYGTGDWVELEGEISSQLVVSYNGVYFQSGVDEVTFRCVVTSFNGSSYEDLYTINNVRDGESVYRGALENEKMTVPANSDGMVGDWSNANTYASLRRGGTIFENSEYTITATSITGVGTVSIDQSKKLITVDSSSIPDNYLVVQWQINFTHEGEVRDTVTLTLGKNVTGKDGDMGNSSIQIYCNTNATSGPSRPTFTEMLSASGGSSGGYAWYPDPTNSTTTLTWTSTGYFNPNTQKMDLLPDGSGYRWTKPVIFSPLNGADGEPGVGIKSIVMQYYSSTSQTFTTGGSWSTSVPSATSGRYIWTRLYITYTNGSTAYTTAVCTTGSDGESGPGLSYRGNYSSGTTYGWSTVSSGNVRDVVYYKSAYYMVNSNKKGTVFSGRTPSSYYGSDGDGNSSHYWVRMNSFDNVATGLLFAEKATIAGWDFYDDVIQAQSGTVLLDGKTVSYNSNGVDQTNRIHIAIGKNATSLPSSAPFRVTSTGYLYASNANISGTINATSGTFTGTINANSGYLRDLTISGEITGTSGFRINQSAVTYGTQGRNNIWAGFGGSAISASAVYPCPVNLINTRNSASTSGNGTALLLQVGYAKYNATPQTWIKCMHYSNYGWGSSFTVESRYFGDTDNMERTVINVGQLTHFQQLRNSGLVSNDVTYEVRVTSNGYLYYVV